MEKERDHCHYSGKCSGAPKEIIIMFQHGLNYIYHFIIKYLAKKFKGQFTCLSENTEKYITFCSDRKRS